MTQKDVQFIHEDGGSKDITSLMLDAKVWSAFRQAENLNHAVFAGVSAVFFWDLSF